MFLVIACLAIFFVIYPADAIPWTSEENKALDADAIAVGQIVSYRDDGAHRYYEISVIKWIKNPQLDQTITMKSITPQVFDPHVPYAIFEKKDLGLFYVKLIDGEWRSTNYSKQIFASEQSQTIYNMKKLVGNNNPDSSVSLERVCKEGHVNAVKNRTGEIYCVKSQTLQKLRERGWAEPLGDIVSQRPSQTKLESDDALSESNFPRCGSSGIPYIPENWQSIGLHPTDYDWENLGRHIIKQEFYEQLKQKDIVFKPACFGIHTGFVEESYPPRFSMCSVVTASNGTDIYLEGMINEFDVTYFDIDNEIPYQCDDDHGGCLYGIENEN